MNKGKTIRILENEIRKASSIATSKEKVIHNLETKLEKIELKYKLLKEKNILLEKESKDTV